MINCSLQILMREYRCPYIVSQNISPKRVLYLIRSVCMCIFTQCVSEMSWKGDARKVDFRVIIFPQAKAPNRLVRAICGNYYQDNNMQKKESNESLLYNYKNAKYGTRGRSTSTEI